MALEQGEALQAYTEFAEGVIKDARIELGAKQPKKSYRARWKGGNLQSFTVTTKRYVPDASGRLSKSLRYEIKEVQGNILVVFYAAEHWYYVNFGRKAGKGMPVDVLRKWIQEKPVRLQQGGGRGFAKQTQKGREALGFLINRKIRTFGIEGNRFFTKTVDIYTDELRENLGRRVARDLVKQISKWPTS
jgi:hypothetical protein